MWQKMCLTNFAKTMAIKKARIKKHGMAKSRQEGKVVYYSLANEDILSAIRVFLKLSENLSMKS